MTDNTLMNYQQAPYPTVLARLVEKLEYRRWRFRLEELDRGQNSTGLTLIITTLGVNSYDPGDWTDNYRVHHYMLVPPAAYNEVSWRRWLLEQVLLVERHEACEFFKIGGVRPYAPHHGPGNDPYVIFERGTDEEARTMYTGEVRPRLRPYPGQGDGL